MKKTELVLVETVSMFRHRYVVEVPKDKSEWALDTVVMNEAKEFSQKWLDETIVSHRIISEKDALNICDQDNDYTKSWEVEKKKEVFFTPWIENESSNQSKDGKAKKGSSKKQKAHSN